jgi:hypothetical protein
VGHDGRTRCWPTGGKARCRLLHTLKPDGLRGAGSVLCMVVICILARVCCCNLQRAIDAVSSHSRTKHRWQFTHTQLFLEGRVAGLPPPTQVRQNMGWHLHTFWHYQLVPLCAGHLCGRSGTVDCCHAAALQLFSFHLVHFAEGGICVSLWQFVLVGTQVQLLGWIWVGSVLTAEASCRPALC